MPAPPREWLDPREWTEEERTNMWLHACMTEACGDENLASELVMAGADYRQVARCKAHGATVKQLRRIFT